MNDHDKLRASPYAERDSSALDKAGGHYCRHVDAMTRFGLHDKSAIAGELAWRDARICELEAVLAALGGKGVTDAMVEAGAKAMTNGAWDVLEPHMQGRYLDMARQALTAAHQQGAADGR